MTHDNAAFLAAADLLEHGEVQPATQQRIRSEVGRDLRAGLPEGARKALADAYIAKGEDVPEWLR